MPGTCSVEWCESDSLARGLCSRHYQQMRDHGRITKSAVERRADPHRDCPRCGVHLPRAAFGSSAKNGDGLQAWCLACARDATYLRRYGLTEDAAVAMKSSGCAVCGSAENLHIDHDHATGAVRGVLCHACNTSLGQLGESPERMLALATYILSFQNVLERHES